MTDDAVVVALVAAVAVAGICTYWRNNPNDADIVEYNPHRDVSDMTAMVAAKFLKEIAEKMITSLES